MPRLLTLWLDYDSNNDVNGTSEEVNTFYKLNKLIRRMTGKLPTYQLLTAFPQLVSRIGHQNKSTYDILEGVIVKVLIQYPQHALWHIVAVGKSLNKVRSNRCSAIFSKAKVGSLLLIFFRPIRAGS